MDIEKQTCISIFKSISKYIPRRRNISTHFTTGWVYRNGTKKIESRHMHHLLRKKNGQLKRLAVAMFLLTGAQQVSAQLRDYLNLPDHDSKRYYLGIALIYNSSRFNVSQHPMFLQSDSVMVVEPENTGGFGLAGMHNFRISDHLEIRAIFPQLLFSYKNLTYHLSHPDPAKEEQPVVTKQIESILLGFPVHIKFLSDRINNFRVYMFGG